MQNTRNASAVIAFLFVIAPFSAAHAVSVSFAWDPNPETDLAGYRLYYADHVGEPYDGDFAAAGPSPVDIPLAALADVNNPGYTLTGLPSCVHLYFALSAYNEADEESELTEPLDGMFVEVPQATMSSGPLYGEVTVSWSPLSANDSGSVDSYRVYYDGDAGQPYEGQQANEGASPIDLASTELSLVLSGLEDLSSVFGAVEAVCSDGTAELSGEVSAAPGLPVCDNGTVEASETCDPISSCPSSCDDDNACTLDEMSGNAASCNASCSHDPIVACQDDDGCCPAGCDVSSDSDCSQSCGDGVVSTGETCDPPGSCPVSCDDGDSCTVDTMTGSADNCNVVCTHEAQTACINGDDCCPSGCTGDIDDNCDGGVVDPNDPTDPQDDGDVEGVPNRGSCAQASAGLWLALALATCLPRLTRARRRRS